MSKSITTTNAPSPGILTYRAYRTNQMGGFVSAEIINAISDNEAMEKAVKLVDGHGIDLWERGRFLASFPALSATEGS